MDWPVRIRLKFKNSIKNYQGKIKDINLKGFQCELKKGLPENKQLRITLFMENSIPLEMKTVIKSQSILPDGTNIYNLNIIWMKDRAKEALFQSIREAHFPELKNAWWQDAR